VSGASVTAEPPVRGAPRAPSEAGRWRRYAVAAAFLAPAAIFLIVWIIYPAIYTFVQSLFRGSGFGEFAGIDNYKTLFTSDNLLTAIKNNAIWVAVVPAAVTAIGLIFAVLTERVSWSVAFKTVVFMPMAVSAFAAGVTWRIMYQQEPDRGAINAAIGSVDGVFSPAGVLSEAAPSTDELKATPGGGLDLAKPLSPGGVAKLGLTRINTDEVPATAKQAVQPEP
jgi:alpha-glucoside transport system permease protein